jgi:hypothetical protein
VNVPISEILELLSAPLNAPVGFVLILVGSYSLYFNVNDAKRKNHRNSERVARIGGWFYILAGAVIIIAKSF